MGTIRPKRYFAHSIARLHAVKSLKSQNVWQNNMYYPACKILKTLTTRFTLNIWKHSLGKQMKCN